MIDNQQRARFAQIMLGISGALAIIIPVVLIFEIGLLNDIQEGNFDPGKGELSDSLRRLAGFANIVALVLTAYAIIAWMHRAYKNLSRAGISTINSENMAIWGWFIPIINFLRPLSITKEIWEQTQLIPFSSSERLSISIKPSSICNYWWIFFILSGIMGNIASRVRVLGGQPSIEQLLTSDYMELTSHVFSLAAAIFGFMVIKQIAEFENEAIISAQINEIGVEVEDASEYFSEEEE